MSIAVMNWVWANSATSGNERLVLLALADACSRDDGTGCWPSAATIARKAGTRKRQSLSAGRLTAAQIGQFGTPAWRSAQEAPTTHIQGGSARGYEPGFA